MLQNSGMRDGNIKRIKNFRIFLRYSESTIDKEEIFDYNKKKI